jgi:hypothetical protein
MGIFLWNILDIESFTLNRFIFWSECLSHYRIKYLLFTVKFQMYMCSLLMHYYENVDKRCRCIFVCHLFFKVYRYLT